MKIEIEIFVRPGQGLMGAVVNHACSDTASLNEISSKFYGH
jgi:hypothetical protein